LQLPTVNGHSSKLTRKASTVKKVGGRGQEVPIFQQTDCVLKNSDLPRYSPIWGTFSPKLCIFGRQFSNRNSIFGWATI